MRRSRSEIRVDDERCSIERRERNGRRGACRAEEQKWRSRTEVVVAASKIDPCPVPCAIRGLSQVSLPISPWVWFWPVLCWLLCTWRLSGGSPIIMGCSSHAQSIRSGHGSEPATSRPRSSFAKEASRPVGRHARVGGSGALEFGLPLVTPTGAPHHGCGLHATAASIVRRRPLTPALPSMVDSEMTSPSQQTSVASARP